MYVYILTTDLNPSDCIAGVRASACITYVQFFLSALVLHMRAYAVWGGSKKILHLLVLTYVGVIVGGSYSAYLLIMSINSLLLLTPNGCIPLLLKDDLWIALVLLIFSASLSFGLLIIKSTKHARVLGNIGSIDSGRSILSVVVKDGIGYFACTLATTIANLIFDRSVKPAWHFIIFFIQGTIHIILCGRLLFHIRAAVDDPSADTYANQMTLSAPVFANISNEHGEGGDPADTDTFGSDF